MKLKTRIMAGSRGPITFARFLHSLEADNFTRSAATLLFAFSLLSAWAAWLVLARVTLYEISEAARLEADQAGYTLEASVPGQVVSTNLTVGKEVKAGDILARLDTSEQRLQLDEERARLASITPQIQSLGSQIATEEQAINEARQAGRVALDEARARVEEADSAAQYAEEQARRLSGLFAEGVISEMEVLRAKSEAKSRRAGVESLRLTVSRIEREQHTRETERRVGVEKLLRERSLLEGQRSASASTVERLQNEIEKRSIRSPVTGLLGEVANSKPGAMLREGDKLASIVPAGEIKVVAEFSPDALGRVRPGQPAHVRLTSFPWTQYGSLTATVTSVASELRDGKIRVELEVQNTPSSLIPVQHGLPGTVEIEVERVSPATLLLRTVKFLAAPLARDGRSGRGTD